MILLIVMSRRVSIFLLISLALINYSNLSSCLGWILGNKLWFVIFFRLFISSRCFLVAFKFDYLFMRFLSSSSDRAFDENVLTTLFFVVGFEVSEVSILNECYSFSCWFLFLACSVLAYLKMRGSFEIWDWFALSFFFYLK